MDKTKSGVSLIELITGVASVGITCLVCVGIYKGFKAVNKYLDTPTIKIERANVIGDEREEQFIQINGQRFYSEIDGKSIESYTEGLKK